MIEAVEIGSDKKRVIIKENGNYIITGGMGGIGRIFANYILENRGNVFLIGRSDLNQKMKENLSNLQSLGKAVYIKANIMHREKVAECIRQIIESCGVINGVIHCAGINEDELFINTKSEDIGKILLPKLYGAYLIDNELSKCKIDFFFLCSSIASRLPNIGQSIYGYANRALDEWAAKRNELVQKGERFGKTISIDWPLWENGRMHISKNKEDMLFKKLGIKPLSNKEGIEAFEAVVQSEYSNIMVLYGDKNVIKSKIAYENDGAETMYDIAKNTMSISDSNFKDNYIETVIFEAVEKTLKLKREDYDLNEEMSSLGFDSISFTDFCNNINEKLNADISPSDMFEFKSLMHLKQYLCNIIENIEIKDTASDVEKINHNEEEKRYDAEIKSESDNLLQDDIAIIGISGKFPKSDNVHEFWENLVNQKDLISEIPADRWDWREYYGDPNHEKNKTNVIYGGFMNSIYNFDPLFFGISPKEAEVMDPQQRLLLESVWNTFEDAGYKISDYSGTSVGVFIGVSTSDYSDLIKKRGIDNSPQVSTGNSHSILANRISYLFDFKGPSISIDTACSSALVSLHMAVEAIRKSECNLAIVGGVNVITSPSLYISFSKSGMLSQDGRCKTFDSRANGYARGEGIGTVLLKPLSHAINDKDQIYGVIRSTAVNHGGHSHSLTAPNPDAQADLIYKVWKNSKIDINTVGYIEAHGTGTSLGDPIEINGLKKAFSRLQDEEANGSVFNHYCGIGTVKSNIGHLESASGIAGLIKVLLALKHKVIPASINIESINPYIKLNDSPFYIVRETKEWEAFEDEYGKKIPRRAGVSSFGFGGVNAHIAIEEYNVDSSKEYKYNILYCVPVSAKSHEALDEYVKKICDYLEHNPNTPLTALSYIFATGREEFEYRVAFVTDSINGIIEKMKKFLEKSYNDKWIYSGYCDKKYEDECTFSEITDDNITDIAKTWVNGSKIDWRSLFKGHKINKISFPTYPFEEYEYRLPNETNEECNDSLLSNASEAIHKLNLNISVRSDDDYIKDHVILGHKILPGAVYLEFAKAFTEKNINRTVSELYDVNWNRAFIVDNDEKNLHLDIVSDDTISFEFTSEGIVNASGMISAGKKVCDQNELFELSGEWENTFLDNEVYDIFSKIGIDYGQKHRVIKKLEFNSEEGLAEILVNSSHGYSLDPYLIDGVFQCVVGILMNSDEKCIYLPYRLKCLTIYNSLKSHCIVKIKKIDDKKSQKIVKFNIGVYNDKNDLLLSIEEFTVIKNKTYQNNNAYVEPLEIFKKVENGQLSIDEALKYLEAF